MNRRTHEINSAIAKLKQHHKNCILCGRSPIEGAHLIPRNNPAKKNNPAKIENIVPLCRRCHTLYDRNKTMESRMDFWVENGRVELAQRIRNIIEP